MKSKLEEILNKLSPHPLDKMVWVGKNYSKKDLVDDLKMVLSMTSNERQ